MENAKITVNCDSFDNSDYGTKEELGKAGWKIEEFLQLCPLDNFG